MTDFEESFQGTLCRLLMYSPFSFNLLVGMECSPSKELETMGVHVKNGRLHLLYNPDFYMSLEESERTYVLIHEMMHLLLHHCTHRTSNDPRRAYKENVAMDLAVNCLITEEPGVQVPCFKKAVAGHNKGDIMSLLPKQFNFPENLSFEQYLALLDEKYPDQTIILKLGGSGSGEEKEETDEEKNGSGGSDKLEIDENCPLGKITKGRIDNQHGKGFDEDAFVDDFVRNTVENIMRNHQWGNIGGKGVEMVLKAQEQPLKWGDILRLKLGPFISFQKEPTRRHWNRHYGKPFLGSTTKCVEPVAVYADTSGSVASEDLSRFIVEIERIAYYTGVYLWSFDANIQDPDEYVLFTRRAIDSIEFKGRGGTRFAPIFEHAKEKGFSQVVILTDGYAEKVLPSQMENMTVIWAITKNGDTNNKPGTVIQMN